MSLPRRVTVPGIDASAGAAPAVHLVTFGCQMNRYDSSLVEERFSVRGWRLVGSMAEADAIVFNTCSVREHAEERVYSWLGELKRAKRERPELVIGVMGCMAQRAEDEIFERAAHVDVVCGTRRIQHMPELVEEVRERRARGAAPAAGARLMDVEMDAEVSVDRTSGIYSGGPVATLAAMRGCDLNCAFCVVPRTRGRVQSRPIADLVREARWLVDGGARAIELLGQTLNSYGEDLPEPGPGEPRGRGRGGRLALADALYALQEVEGLARVRLITNHAAYVTPALARAIRECPVVERFLPLPLQSGSDRVLRAMRRGYTTELYRRRVEILRAEVPELELGSDWIVGFPGESDGDFEQSLAFAAEIGFAQGYVFEYSRRPDTPAASRADDVPAEIKLERHHRLLAAVERVARGRMERQIGREQDVLVERVSEKRAGQLVGRTHQGLPIRFEGDAALVGRLVRVEALEASAFGLGGRIAAPSAVA